MLTRNFKVGVRVVELDEPPFIPRDYAELRYHLAMLSLDIAMLLAVRAMFRRIALAQAIEVARIGSLAGLSVANGWLLAKSFLALASFTPGPSIYQVALGFALAWVWFEFTLWWRERGLDKLLGL